MVLMRFRKIRLSSLKLIATPGQSWPISAPTAIATRIHVVRDFRFRANARNPDIASQRMMIIVFLQPGKPGR